LIPTPQGWPDANRILSPVLRLISSPDGFRLSTGMYLPRFFYVLGYCCLQIRVNGNGPNGCCQW